jgi:predicted nuclease of predicted toxin-antitoxin system
VKFLVDQNLPTTLSAHLIAEGQEARHTRDLGFERAPDTDLFAWCRRNDAVLLTADKRLTKFLAEQHATSPSVVVFRSYGLNFVQLAADLFADLDRTGGVVTHQGHAVFSMASDRPTRVQLLPLISEVG